MPLHTVGRAFKWTEGEGWDGLQNQNVGAMVSRRGNGVLGS